MEDIPASYVIVKHQAGYLRIPWIISGCVFFGGDCFIDEMQEGPKRLMKYFPIPWLVFWMIHVKDSLLPMGNPFGPTGLPGYT